MLNVYVYAIFCATLLVFIILSLMCACTWIINHIRKEFLAMILVTIFAASALIVSVLIINFFIR